MPALQRTAYVRQHQTSDFEGTPERQFDHHLLHQVTCDTLLKAERKLGHGAAARWLAERTRGRSAEFLAMTGEYAERAGDTALAIDCFEQAGTEAQNRFANGAAQSYLNRALALLGEADPARAVDLWYQIEDIADILGDRAAQDVARQQIAAILDRHPDDVRQSRLTFSLALLADRRGDAAASERLAHQAAALAERCGAARWAAMAHGQLAWLHMARQDYAGASRHLAIGLPWAGRIPGDRLRAETEAKLLTLSGMVSAYLSRPDEARGTQQAVLTRGEALGKPRVQLGALGSLASVASDLGHWDEMTIWGERICTLAHTLGSRKDVASGQLRLAIAAEALGDADAATRLYEQSLIIYTAIGDRRMQAITRRFLAGLHLSKGDAQAAQACCAASLALHRSLQEVLEACEVTAIWAQCAVSLGRPDQAQDRLNAALAQLQRDLADCPANETIALRWRCQLVMVALDDERAVPLLDQLFADVQAHATLVTDAEDRDRLIQAQPFWRAIGAAHARRGPAP